MMRFLHGWFGLVLATAIPGAVGLAACGGSDELGNSEAATKAAGNDGSGGTADDLLRPEKDNIKSLAFDPPTATVASDGVTAVGTSFTLMATLVDDTVVAVPPDSLQFDRPDLATLQGGPPATLTATGQYAGNGKLRAIYGGIEAVAELTIEVHRKDLAGDIDAAAISALDAQSLDADPAVTTLSYPYDETVFPLGLSSPQVMWNGPNSSVYRLRYAQEGYTLDTYGEAGQVGRLRADQQLWDQFTMSNRGGPVTVTLSRYDSTQDAAYLAASQSWTIAPESLRGAIYYWTTSGGGGLARLHPGSAKPTKLAEGTCIGCHAVSADGSTLVASWVGQPADDHGGKGHENRPWFSWDLNEDKLEKLSTEFAGNLAVSPTGKYTVHGAQTLHLSETATAKRIDSGLEALSVESGKSGFMTPSFSPDGRRLAVVEGTGHFYNNLRNGNLVTVDFDPNTEKFSNRKALAATSSFPVGQRVIDYPSFSPDSNWLAFHTTDIPGERNVGGLWLQNVSGSTPIRLDRLTDSSPNSADHNHSLEPTFNPQKRGGYYWVVFTSSRQWGNALTGAQDDIAQERLWVAAIDPQIGTVDPSHPPFYLEGQDGTKNRRGFWTMEQCIAPDEPTSCGAGFECCSGFCVEGACVAADSAACFGVGESCSRSSECCNSGSVECSDDECVASDPK